MRCRRCNYTLWNIKDRVCPECGEPFLPSEQDFVVNSVKFMCPHCSQDYYGEGARGHLVPFEFDCVRCANHITMDQMVLMPIAGYDESVTQADLMPWRERARIGYIKAWFKTIYRAMFMPPVLMRLDPGPSVGAAWLFMLITHVIYGLPGGLMFVPFLFIGGGGMTPNGPAFALASFAIGFFVVLPLVMALLWGLIAHAILVMTGPTEHRLGGTFQAICYSSAADIIKVVPCFNVYFFWAGWIWWAVSATMMLQERQQVKGWRACLATLLPVGFVAAAGVGLLIFAMYFAVQASSVAMNNALRLNVPSVQRMGQALLDREATSGSFPAHAIELLADGTLQHPAFVVSPITQPMNVPIGLESLQTWPFLDALEQATLLQDVLDAQPANVIAHRLGDYVFTYHDIDPDADDADLWILIASPDPSVQNWGMMAQEVVIMKLDGTTEALDNMALANELELQNVLREEHNLDPLPHPDDVTHESPAVGGG